MGGKNSVFRKPFGKNNDISNNLTRTFGRTPEDALKAAAIIGAGVYTGGLAVGAWGSGAAATGVAASSGAATTGYLGASTSFGAAAAPTLTSASQLSLGASALTASAPVAATTGYLGAATSFGSSVGTGSTFLAGAKSFAGETLKTAGSIYLQKALSPQAGPIPTQGGDVTSMPYVGGGYQSPGQAVMASTDYSGFLPIVVIGGIIFAAVAAFKN